MAVRHKDMLAKLTLVKCVYLDNQQNQMLSFK